MSRDRCQLQFIHFLQGELSVPEAAIALALKSCEHDTTTLHMILWQYGFISVDQLGKVFDWLSDRTHLSFTTQRPLTAARRS